MEYPGWVYLWLASRENPGRLSKNQVYVLPRAEDKGYLSGDQYLVGNE